MPKHYKMKMKARGGAMAQGGMPASGVGSTVGQWVEDWLLGWLGFADGGELPPRPAEVTDALLKEIKKDVKADIKSGDLNVAMARGGMPASGVGSTVGQWVEDWLLGWLGFAEGGMMPKKKHMGHSVFH
jgi:hypothetical protein